MLTEIQWTSWPGPDGALVPGYTFNPWSGCTRVSSACTSCYAEAAPPSMRRGAQWGPAAPRVHASEAYWRGPVQWNAAAAKRGERRRVFCASMSDVFEQHQDAAEQAKLEAARERLFALVAATPSLDWLLLTKRAAAMAAWARRHPWPANAWAGCTAEGQREFDERAPHLLSVPARYRFLSIEPIRERISFGTALGACECVVESLEGAGQHSPRCPATRPRIDWVIVGGESGRGAAMVPVDAVHDVVRRCCGAGVACFVKQLGSAWASQRQGLHQKGGDPLEWHESLRVRQWPDQPWGA